MREYCIEVTGAVAVKQLATTRSAAPTGCLGRLAALRAQVSNELLQCPGSSLFVSTDINPGCHPVSVYTGASNQHRPVSKRR